MILFVVSISATTRAAVQPARAGASPIANIEIWARSGAPLVVPFVPTQNQIDAGIVPARLSGGAALYAPLWWIGPSTIPSQPGSETGSPGDRFIHSRAAVWMGVPLSWEALESPAAARRTDLSPDGRWYLIIDIPPESDGQDLVLADMRIRTGWIRRAPFATSRTSQPIESAWTRACLAALRNSPFERWRARLAAGEPLLAPGPAFDEFSDKTIESLAEQVEAVWSEALERLAAADAAVAADFRARLTFVSDFGNANVPSWPGDDGTLTRLSTDLLSPLATPQQRVQRAREWLAVQPRYAAWIADDAAVLDANTGAPAAQLSGLSLAPGSPTAAMIILRPGVARAEDVVGLAPGTVGTADFAPATSVNRDDTVVVQVAGWSATRAVVPRAVEARPPGITIGPFFADWTLPTWRESCTDTGDARAGRSPAGTGRAVVAPGRRTSALLLRQDAPGIGASPATTSWTLYFECESADATPAVAEELLVSLSGVGGELTLRVYADGTLVTSQGESGLVTVNRTLDRWSAWVPIPGRLISDGRWLRLGIARIDAQGRRSAWPRPMFPWDTEPAHAAILLDQWLGLPGGK